MAKRKGRQRKKYPPRTASIDLDHVPDTDSTSRKANLGRNDTGSPSEHDGEVDAPFVENVRNYITWEQLSLGWKVAAVVSAVLFGVGAPSIWFASGLNTNVTNIQDDVKDIKTTTNKLTSNSIKQSSTLGQLTTDVSNLREDVEMIESKTNNLTTLSSKQINDLEKLEQSLLEHTRAESRSRTSSETTPQ